MKFLKRLGSPFFAILLLASVFAGPAWSETKSMGVSEAHELAIRGEVALIDVRTPKEWQQTGIGETAQAVSMHLPGFLKKIRKIVKGNKAHPIALMCATGMRSARMQRELIKLGYTNVIDVRGGMMGNNTSRGWLETGLPTKQPE